MTSDAVISRAGFSPPWKTDRIRRRAKARPIFALLVGVAFVHALSAQDALRNEAIAAMKKAAAYFHDHVASHGGYVYYTSEDLTKRWGEGEATRD
jgi:hypothetical protein